MPSLASLSIRGVERTQFAHAEIVDEEIDDVRRLGWRGLTHIMFVRTRSVIHGALGYYEAPVGLRTVKRYRDVGCSDAERTLRTRPTSFAERMEPAR